MAHYYYLIYSLFFLACFGGALWLRRDLFRDTIPAMLFGAVAGPVSELFYFQDYWRPPTLFGIGRVSLEDVIFGVSIFSLTFLLYPLIARQKLSPAAAGNDRHVRSFGTIAVAGVCMTVLVGLLGVNSVLATAITFVLLWLGLCTRRPDLLLPGLVTGFTLAALALTFYIFFLDFFLTRTDLQQAWLLFGTRWGKMILGNVPVSELIWFFGVGCFLSVFDLFVNKKVYQPGD